MSFTHSPKSNEERISRKQISADLRSPVSNGLRRGLFLSWSRISSLLLSDVLAVSLAWNLAVKLGTQINSPWTSSSTFFFANLFIQIAVLAARESYRQDACRRGYIDFAKAIALAQIVVLAIAFLYEPDYYVSRSTFLLSWIFTTLLCVLFRFTLYRCTEALRERGAMKYATFLITDPKDRERNMKFISQNHRYALVGVADSVSLDLKNRQETFDTLREMGISEVFVSWTCIQKRLHLCWYFRRAGMTMRILPADLDSGVADARIAIINDVPTLTISAPLILGGGYWLKRGFDFCCASLLIFALLPVYFTIGALIRMDSQGSILFKQARVGLHGRTFNVWKFRTMVINADELQAALEANNEMKDGVLFKMKNDPRITRVGGILRRYSLDELPQLFNVLMGQMSLVGPRPLPIRDVARFQSHHFIRQEVLPGITGLWQVSGRSDIDNFDDAVRLDLTYIANWSFWLDVKILMATFGVVFSKKGAY